MVARNAAAVAPAQEGGTHCSLGHRFGDRLNAAELRSIVETSVAGKKVAELQGTLKYDLCDERALT